LINSQGPFFPFWNARPKAFIDLTHSPATSVRMIGMETRKDARVLSQIVIACSVLLMVLLTLPLTLKALGVLSGDDNQDLGFMWLWVFPAFIGMLGSPALVVAGIVAVCLQRTRLTRVALLCSLAPFVIFAMTLAMAM
jgi:hypothetical protein